MTFCDLLKFLSQVSKFLQMTSFDFILFSFDFVCSFFFFGRKETLKECKNTYLPLFLSKVGYGKQTKRISSG